MCIAFLQRPCFPCPCSAGMRMVFKSIMLSMAAMGNVSIVCMMFFLIFAILGTQLFMGHLWR